MSLFKNNILSRHGQFNVVLSTNGRGQDEIAITEPSTRRKLSIMEAMLAWNDLKAAIERAAEERDKLHGTIARDTTDLP